MLEQLKKCPLVPVFFHPDKSYAQQIVQACYEGGLRFFEFTNRGKEALEVFEALEKQVRSHCPAMKLGIGSIYTPEDAERFLNAGADFVVQPVTSELVGEVCKRAGKPWIPGAFTPNEIWSAWQMGANIVKVFPASLLGPEYIRALRGPMPEVPIMVTGGVEPTSDAINDWLSAGVQALGIGSQLFKGDFPRDFPALSHRISILLKSIRPPTVS